MWLRQIGNARSERQDGERLRARKRERGVIFLFLFFLRCALTLKDARWFFDCIRGVLMRALQPPFTSLNRMTEVQVAFLCKQLPRRSVIEQNTVPSNFTWRSVTPDLSVMVMEGGITRFYFPLHWRRSTRFHITLFICWRFKKKSKKKQKQRLNII